VQRSSYVCCHESRCGRRKRPMLLRTACCQLREVSVKQLRAGEACRNVAVAIDHVQVGRAIHVIEFGDRARIGLAVADLRPGDAFLADEALNLGRFVVEGDADDREPALLVLPVEFFE